MTSTPQSIGSAQASKWLAALVTVLLAPFCYAAPPAAVEATYQFYRNDLLFATVKQQYRATGGRYEITSAAQTDGVVALLRNERITRISRGLVMANGLRPEFFQEKRTSKGKDRVRTARFDWPALLLTVSYDDKSETFPLAPKTQDWSSLFFQFLFQPPKKETVEVTVTDGKRVKSYAYRFIDEVPLTTSAGKFDTLHFAHADANGERSTEIWLAASKAYVPVRLTQSEDGNVIEQRLTRLRLK